VRLILDAGALIALERDAAQYWRRVAQLLRTDARSPLTHAGVIAQVWRGGAGRQAGLARALPGMEIVSFDLPLARAAGVLLARSGLSDAIDAAVVALAVDGDRILTSDPDDIDMLAVAAGRRVDIVAT